MKNKNNNEGKTYERVNQDRSSLELVFRVLPVKDLLNCRSVCKSWKNLADMVFKIGLFFDSDCVTQVQTDIQTLQRERIALFTSVKRPYEHITLSVEGRVEKWPGFKTHVAKEASIDHFKGYVRRIETLHQRHGADDTYKALFVLQGSLPSIVSVLTRLESQGQWKSLYRTDTLNIQKGYVHRYTKFHIQKSKAPAHYSPEYPDSSGSDEDPSRVPGRDRKWEPEINPIWSLSTESSHINSKIASLISIIMEERERAERRRAEREHVERERVEREHVERERADHAQREQHMTTLERERAEREGAENAQREQHMTIGLALLGVALILVLIKNMIVLLEPGNYKIINLFRKK